MAGAGITSNTDKPLDLSGPSLDETLAKMIFEDATSANPHPEPSKPKSKFPLGILSAAALIGGNAADLGTTVDTIRSGRGREKSPLAKNLNLPAMGLMKGIGTAGETYALNKLAEKHPKLAKALAVGGGAALGAVAYRNTRVGRVGAK